MGLQFSFGADSHKQQPAKELQKQAEAGGNPETPSSAQEEGAKPTAHQA